jgi:hypothetical protein
MTVFVLALDMAPFLSVDAGNIAIIAGLAISFWRLRSSAVKEKNSILVRQTEMHEENKHRFDVLTSFRQEQLELNRRRDEQIDELRQHTGELLVQTREMVQIAKGFHRRLEMLEDRRHDDRRQQGPRGAE